MTDTWEPRPLPRVNPETEPFWLAAAEGKLLVCTCQDCGLTYYYPRSLCPDCFSDDVDWHPAAGTGTVYSYTVSSAVPDWPEDDLPIVVASVELEEGPRVLTNLLDCDPDEVAVGDKVEVTFVETGREDVAIPAFVPR